MSASKVFYDTTVTLIAVASCSPLESSDVVYPDLSVYLFQQVYDLGQCQIRMSEEENLL